MTFRACTALLLTYVGLICGSCGPTLAEAKGRRGAESSQALAGTAVAADPPRGDESLFYDAHLHLTNYVQEGLEIREMLALMGTDVGRATLFGIPLQQQWSHRVSGDDAPTYYLQSDAPLYYYSFTDAAIAMAYRSLTDAERDRFDPMITGFNPTDMYAADHIRRVLLTFPGVFSGIGEFTIHKEFVSSKVEPGVPSLTDPAVDRILSFAGEVGLVVLLHNDVDVPFPEEGSTPAYLDALTDLLRRHSETTIIWAHAGLGRVVRPVEDHVAMLERVLSDPALSHVCIDLSWVEVAKYVVASPETTRRTAALIERFPERFLFGTDVVAPGTRQQYLDVFYRYNPLWRELTPETGALVRKGNYRRLFDRARGRVRAWEKAHAGTEPTGRERLKQSPAVGAHPRG